MQPKEQKEPRLLNVTWPLGWDPGTEKGHEGKPEEIQGSVDASE